MARDRSLQTSNKRLRDWQTRVEHSRVERDKVVPLWLQILEYFRSNPPTNWPANSMKLQVNYVFAWFELMWPTLTFNKPNFTCEPMNESSETSAPTVESAINGELRSLQWHRQLNRAIFDFLLPGKGILQSGYYGGALTPDPGISDETEPSNVSEQEERGLETSLKAPRVNSDLPYGIQPGRVYVRHHKPENFLIDPQATNLDDALWCGIEYIRSVESVKKDPQYKHTQELKADTYELPPTLDLEQYRKRFNRDPLLTFVRLIQIWDIVERKVLTFNMNYKHLLSERDWTLPSKRFPFYDLSATEDNYTFWRQAPAMPWINLIEEFNLTISNRLDHLSRNKPKVAYNKSLIDEPELENYLRSVNMSCVGVDNLGPDGDVRGAIAPLQMPLLPADHWAHVAEIRQRMGEVSGVSEFDLGGIRPGERPATEINRVSAGSDLRRFGLASRITTPLSALGEDVRAYMEKYYSKERTARIVGDQGNMEWVKYTGSKLRGEYQFDCNIEDLSPMTRQERQQRAGVALQTLTPYTQVGSPTPRLDVDPLLRLAGRDLQLGPYLRFFPMIGPPMEPGHEFFLMSTKGMEIAVNPQDDDDWHLFAHYKQRGDEKAREHPTALVRLENHIEFHESQKLEKQRSAEALQEKERGGQPGPGGIPGPAPGTPSNNATGGAGVFAGSAAGVEQVQSGGADISNLAGLLRGAS